MRSTDGAANAEPVIVHVQCAEWMQDEGEWEEFAAEQSPSHVGASAKTVGTLSPST
jgi:hypothetical protein